MDITNKIEGQGTSIDAIQSNSVYLMNSGIQSCVTTVSTYTFISTV